MRRSHYVYNQKVKTHARKLFNRALGLTAGLLLVLTPVASFLLPSQASAEDPAKIRVHQKYDLNKDGELNVVGTPSEPEQHIPGWKIRLYDTGWSPANYGDGGSNEVTTTNAPFEAAAVFNAPADQDYYLCIVDQDGYTQSFVRRILSAVDYEDNQISNGGPNQADESDLCAIVNNLEAGKVSTHAFGQIIEDGRIHIHAVTETNNNDFPDWGNGGPEPHEAGWTMRLYDNSPGEWQPVIGEGDTDNEVVTTGQFYNNSAKFIVAPGIYHVCEVLPATHTLGFAQTVTGWLSTDDTGVPNSSPNASIDEAEDCIEVNVQPGAQNAHVFGNVLNFTPPNAAQQTDQIVKPSDLNGFFDAGFSSDDWFYLDDTVAISILGTTDSENGTHSIDANPTPTLNDYGAAKLDVSPGDKWNLSTWQYSGTELGDIAELGFRVHTTDPVKAYLNLDIDFNQNTPSFVGYQGRLVFVPSSPVSSWGDFETVASNSQWSWSRFDENGDEWPDGETSELRSWNEIVQAFPNATISGIDNFNLLGGLHLRADGDGGPSTSYFDFVYLATATENIRYNFEPESLDDGEIRIHMVYDVDEDGEPDWGDTEGHEAGWTMRLYDEDWNPVAAGASGVHGNEVTTTGLFFENSANYLVQPGLYRICSVNQDGFSQSFARTITSWVTWPESDVTNLSGESDEAPLCIELEVLPGDQSAHVFGNFIEEEEGNNTQEQTQRTTTTTSTNSNQNNNQNEGNPNPPAFAAFAAAPAGAVLGDNDGDDGDDGLDDGTGTLGETIDSTDPNFAIGAVLGEGSGWLANWWKWLLLAIPLLLIIFFLLARRGDNEEDSTSMPTMPN